MVEFSKAAAPLTPFITEEIYRNLTGEKSVHLADFPVEEESFVDETNNGDYEGIIAKDTDYNDKLFHRHGGLEVCHIQHSL